SYEFVSADDPKSALLVPGDIRFNIIEWDLVNKAPYGGLGPSVASQTTGQTFSANVLVQGPTIVEIYKEWFRVSAAAQELVAENKTAEVDQLVLAARRSIITKLDAASSMPQHQLNLGSELKFRHNSQDMKLQDRIAARQDFFDTPAGETYESYMHGYFIDLVTHELGHNLGLRHNFKGNLLATADGAKPSGSVMEYLNREFRHRDSIGEYDLMAIRYGYTGAMPTRKDIFCTDENVVGAENPTFSAECSRDDATGDSFAYLGRILDRALDKIATPKEPTAPTWTVADVNKELTLAVTGRIAYGTSAEATSKTWLNWNSSGSRPRRPSAITQFVFKSLKDQLCAENLRSAPNRKKTEVAKQVTLKNLADLDAMVEAISVKFKLGTRLKCGGS
ncbi:MAG: zinc-dependent metalloprotease, partial [Proteobacteria bacterium]|nr:zinc-dependent metalloprotease [Pseudomonadota bacterium]